MTQTEFIDNEIRLWGYDAIESLYNQGFMPYLTERGWRWLPDLTPAPSCATVGDVRDVALTPVGAKSRN